MTKGGGVPVKVRLSLIKLGLCPAPSPAFEEGGSEGPSGASQPEEPNSSHLPNCSYCPSPGVKSSGRVLGRLGRDPCSYATNGNFRQPKERILSLHCRIGNQLVLRGRRSAFPQHLGAWVCVCVAGLGLEEAMEDRQRQYCYLASGLLIVALPLTQTQCLLFVEFPQLYTRIQLGYSKLSKPRDKEGRNNMTLQGKSGRGPHT